MTETKNQAVEDSVPFYPDHVRTELWVAGGLVAVVFIVGAFGLAFPVGLGDPADPMNTPAHVRPEWYFLALYQVLKFIPKTIGALIPILASGALILWPFVDRRPDTSPRAWRVRLSLVMIILVILIGLTIWGEVS